MHLTTGVRDSSMRKGWLWLLLMAGFHAGAIQAASIREVLAEFETGTTSPAFCAGDQMIGRSKEVSRFQIMPEVWRQYSRSRDYSNPDVAWETAERILQDRREAFRRGTGRDWNYRELYLMWNAPGAFTRANFNLRRVSRIVRERAERFSSLAGRDGATSIAGVRRKLRPVGIFSWTPSPARGIDMVYTRGHTHGIHLQY